MPCSCRFLILGHSLCKRLHKRVLRRGSIFSPTFNLDGDAEVYFHGVSGLTCAQLKASHLRKVEELHPQVVFLQVGGNDINDETDPEELALEIVALATLLRLRFGVRRVIISKIMPRFEATGEARHLSWIKRRSRDYLRHYTVCARRANRVLAREAASYHYIKFWDHNGKFPHDRSDSCRRRFSRDGTHLSGRGLYRYYKSIRGAITSTHCLTSARRHPRRHNR